ncbi:MAG TPA: HAMP domain-containing sensor histidine kinase [Ktedonobacterales bacterium]|nr:HAMP domain-containing sensor histidine kinase [Ktedonobacterales bacterium]
MSGVGEARTARQRIAAAWASWVGWLRALVVAPNASRSPDPLVDPHPFAVLRRRLVATNLLATALVLLIVSGAVYLFEANVEMAQIDQQLASETTSQSASGLHLGANPADQNETPYNPRQSNLFSITVSPSGRVLQDDDQVQPYGLPDMALAQPVLTGAQPTVVATMRHGIYEFRLYTGPIVQQGVIVGAVQSGMSLASYAQHLRDLTRALVALDVVIMLFTLGASVYLTDRALKPARHSFERQRQFAAGASHELRTPLALIRSLAELVADHRCPPNATAHPSATEEQESVTSDARDIIHEVDYMTRLVTDLLLLARDEHDRRALNWVRVDVRRITQGVVDKVSPLATARGITLRSELDGRVDSRVEGPSALVEGDPDRLRELALILIENAVRYTPRGGSVMVNVTQARGSGLRGERHGHITLTVRDTGVGIAPEDQPHVFEPFYRASSSTMRRANAGSPGAQDVSDGSNGVSSNGTNGADGSGLGLALAHWIVEAHGGDISLMSAPGKGTTFSVTLPLLNQSRTTTPLDNIRRETSNSV